MIEMGISTYDGKIKSDLYNSADSDFRDMIIKLGVSKTRLINELYDPNIIVYMNIGRFDKQKGHDRLIRAFEKQNLEFPNARLIIIAPYGPIKNETIDLVKNSQVKENIYILGRMSNPYPLLSLVDAFVLSSYYEGLGLVVFEALALNKPVITVNLDTTMKYLSHDDVIVVENSEKGIYDGFLKFRNGIRPNSNFDFDSYNQERINEFEDLFE